MSLILTGNTSNITIDSTSGITFPNSTLQASAGSILQVAQGIKTDIFSTSVGMGSATEITGLSASITPKFNTSKILISVTIGELGASSDSTYNLLLYRGSTAICLGDAAGSRVRSSAAGGIPTSGATWRSQVPSFSFLDTPATTNATTYTVRVGGNGSSVITINYDYRNTDVANDSARTPSTIIVQEVAG